MTQREQAELEGPGDEDEDEEGEDDDWKANSYGDDEDDGY